MERPLKILLEPSRIGQSYYITITALCVLSIGLASLPLWGQALLWALVFWRGFLVVKSERILCCQQLEYCSGSWRLHVGNVLSEAELAKNVFIGFGIVVMQFILPSGKPVRLLLWPDSATDECLRKLRFFLLAH
ncbi:MAG TPA: hypothetical protein PK031_07035 [Pseudomonadales bacterium]|nr:hypothetical protein [Pseudomonadales bacterium]